MKIVKKTRFLESCVKKAIELGADSLEIEYKDGYEEIIAIQGNIGIGIERIKSSSTKAKHLRESLYEISKKKFRMYISDQEYKLKVKIYDSFGEDAFLINIHKM